MGGHSTKQTVTANTSLVSNMYMSTTQNCLTVSQGTQVMYVGGSGNVFENNQQSMTLGADMKCVQNSVNQTKVNQNIQNEIVQKLKDQQVAMTQWLDTGKTEVSANIEQKVETTITINTIQNCIAGLTGKQIMAVSGQGNVFRNNVQTQALTVVTQCVQGSQNTQDMTTDIANTINQHSEYKSENPLAFITDAIQNVIKSVIMVAAIAFIVIVAMVFLFMVLKPKSATTFVMAAQDAMGSRNANPETAAN
jgi:hypothetical protein